MNCPLCGGGTAVCDSRPEADSVNRRRRCLSCDYKFRTVEVDMDMLDAGFRLSAKDTVDLTEVKESIKQLKEAIKQLNEGFKHLNKFMEEVNQ